MKSEKNYSEYEVKVIQEISCNIVPKIQHTHWADMSECEVNEIIRNNVFDEFCEYLVDCGYLASTSILIDNVDYPAHNTSDLEVIDAFCNMKLKEIGYKVLPTFKQANYDTLVEIGLQGQDFMCELGLGHDELNAYAIEFDEFWGKHCEEEKYYMQGWIQTMEEFLDTKRKEYDLPSAHDQFVEKQKKASKLDSDVAYILVQLTEDFSKDLYEKYDKTMNDTTLRGEFLFNMAQEIAKSADWKNPDLTAGEVINNAIGKKKEELVMSKAKFKVGDKVVILYDYEVEEHTVQSVNWNDKRQEFWYGLSCSTYAATDHEVYENYIYKDVSDLITRLQTNLDESK